MKTILLDTNVLLLPYQEKTDIFTLMDKQLDFPFELVVLDKTIVELESIVKTQSGKDKEAASFALQVVEKKGIKVVKSGEGHTDDLILEKADEETIVATHDRGLKTRLKEKGVPILTFRQGGKAVVEGMSY